MRPVITEPKTIGSFFFERITVIKRLMLALTIATLSLLFLPSSAEAKPARVPYNGVILEVANSLPASWDVKGSVRDIDYYTGSSMRVVSKCSGKYSCVTIKPGTVKGKPVGWYTGTCKNVYRSFTDRKPTRFCSILVDLAKSKKLGVYGYYTKRWLVRHEVGHWLTLVHRSKCDSTMYEKNRCNGHVPPNTFTASERAVLRKH